MPLSTQLIRSALAALDPPHVYIAYSGGVDSHVLLHLCAAVAELKPRLIAVYVHHGLQPEAEAWGAHCEQTVARLGVDFRLLRVDAAAQPGESPEAAARNARYAALQSLLAAGDVMLVAQHRDDQLETVLLQLFRGSGLRGLSGMPERSAFGPGWLLRPLLDTPKQAIDDYARRHALAWIEDPSNQSAAYDRNFLRNAIIPSLKQRWPALDRTVARAARHCAAGERLIIELADGLMAAAFDASDHTLDIVRLAAYSSLHQEVLLRRWFLQLGLAMPSHNVIERIRSEVLAARADSDPVVATPVCRIRRYRNKLYCLPPTAPDYPARLDWPRGQSALPINERQTLICSPSSAGIARQRWRQADITVKFRSGGEKIRLPNRVGHHALKKLFQEAGIPPWQRATMPLIYLDGRLAAIGGWWISADFYHEEADACVVPVVENIAVAGWQGNPAVG